MGNARPRSGDHCAQPSPPNAANAAGVRPVDWITPAFAEYLKIPDPKAGSKHWEIGTSGPGYLWPPRQLDPGQQLARMMLANPDAFAERFLAHEAAAGVYLDEGVRRALEDNQRQIAEAEQRQREREEREPGRGQGGCGGRARSLARQARLASIAPRGYSRWPSARAQSGSCRQEADGSASAFACCGQAVAND